MKRLSALILLFSLLISIMSLSSCGGGAEATKPENVFRETVIELPEELSGSELNFNSFSKVGDIIYMLVYSYNEENYEPTYFVASYDLTSGTFGEPVFAPKMEQSENGGSNLSTFTASKDGTMFFAMEKYSYTDDMGYNQSYEILTYRDGEFESTDVSMPEDAEMGFYINSMAALDDGSLVLSSWNGIRVMTPDGNVKAVELPDADNFNVENMIEIDGKLYVSIYTYSENSYGSTLYELDAVGCKLGDSLDLENTSNIYNMIFGPGYDYYYNDRSSIWGGTFGNEEMTEVVNFINSDINSNDIRNIVPISPDRFFVASRNYGSGRTGMSLYFIDRVPEDEIVEKKMLRMAVVYASYSLRTAIIDFNKSNDTYRITIDDYSRYNTDENYNAGFEKLNSDIITGNTPDLFLITSDMPYSIYAARGIFADINVLMDADPDFDRSLYLENVFEAFEQNGELYTVVPYVGINTFAAKRELGEPLVGWDLDDYVAYQKANPDMRMFDYDYNRASFVQMFMMFCRDSFIDAGTGECHFDSPEFRTLLEIASTIPEQSIWETDMSEEPNFWQEYEQRFKEDRVLLSNVYISDLNYSYKNLLNYTFGAEPVFVGFPSGEGNGAVFNVYEEYAIAEDSDFKEGAWQFIKSLIAPDKQMPYFNEEFKYWEYPAGGIPIYKEAVDKMAEIAMTPPEENDGNMMGGIAVPLYRTTVTVDSVASSAISVAVPEVAVEVEAEAETEAVTEETAEVEIPAETEALDKVVTHEPAIEDDIIINDGAEDFTNWQDPYAIPLTEKQVNDILELINGTTRVSRYDNDMNDIINEELDPYFKGSQSLDNTVKHIQDRVSKYINETR